MSWGKTADNILQNPKVRAAARDLGIPAVHMVGHLNVFWAAVRTFNEDGDLSGRQDDEIAEMAAYEGDPAFFVAVLEKRRFLDGRLVHDWLEYHGRSLVAKYKTHGRSKLVAIWALHGKEYGRKESVEPDGDGCAEPGEQSGTIAEQTGNTAGTDRAHQEREVDQEGETEALNPQAQGKQETKSPIGGAGGKTVVAVPPPDLGSSIFCAPGLRAQGSAPPGMHLPCAGFTTPEVFAGMESFLKRHGVFTIQDLQRLVDHCGVTPSYWTMVLMDKVQAAYRADHGPAMVDTAEADPVAMTVGGLVFKHGKERHRPTRAAQQFFAELMQDHPFYRAGEPSRYKGNITTGLVTAELTRRKGGKNHDTVAAA